MASSGWWCEAVLSCVEVMNIESKQWYAGLQTCVPLCDEDRNTLRLVFLAMLKLSVFGVKRIWRVLILAFFFKEHSVMNITHCMFLF